MCQHVTQNAIKSEIGRVRATWSLLHITNSDFHNLVPRVLSLPPSRKYPGCGSSRVYMYKSNPHWGWVRDFILSVKFSSVFGREKPLIFFTKRRSRSYVDFQVALLWAGYTNVKLKVKQVIFLEPKRTDIKGHRGFTYLLFLEFVLNKFAFLRQVMLNFPSLLGSVHEFSGDKNLTFVPLPLIISQTRDQPQPG